MLYQYGDEWGRKGADADAGVGEDSRASSSTSGKSRPPGVESMGGSRVQGTLAQQGSTGRKFEEILNWWPKRMTMDDEAQRQDAVLQRLSFQAHDTLGLTTRLSGALRTSFGYGPVIHALTLLCLLC